MRRLLALGFACAVALCAPAAAAPRVELAAHVDGELLLRFRPGTPTAERARVLAALGATDARPVGASGAERVRLAARTVADGLALLAYETSIDYAEPNYLYRTQELPNDPLFPLQWGLSNTGQSGGTAGADIRATTAWDVFTGDPAMIVGVIDTGIDLDHPDLRDNVYVNPNEAPDNGADDDGNGFVDDVAGWDCLFDTNDADDDNGHGTHVAGIVGAVGDNALGVTGVAWRVRLIPLKFLDANGLGNAASAAICIDYAVQAGAKVINASWGGGGPSQTLFEAIQRANLAGVSFVAAAGNGNPGVNNDSAPFYPASYNVPNIVSVAASDHNDRLWPFSNYGPNSVDIAAPGAGIYSTFAGGGYGFLSGTSMAAPQVAGVMALIRSRFPTVSPATARSLLLDRADPIPNLAGRVLSGARINAFQAIAEADGTPPARTNDLVTADPDSTRIDLLWTAPGDDGTTGTAAAYDVRLSLTPFDAESFLEATQLPDPPDPAAAGSPERMRVTGLSATTRYYFALRTRDEFGNWSPVSNVASGMTTGPPSVTIEPDSVGASLYTGGRAERAVRIENHGDGEYLFDVSTTRLQGGGLNPGSVEAYSSGRVLVEAADGLPVSPLPYAPPVPRSPADPPRFEAAGEPAAGVPLLIVQSGTVSNEIAGLLRAMPGISRVDVFDARFATPTLAELQGYASVMVMVNIPFADRGALGDVLADYADGGGGVVLTLASFVTGWQVEGRFLSEGYYPFNLGGGPSGQAALGEFDASHPIMAGVEELAGALLGVVTVAEGGKLVASWDDGRPLVATRGPSVVAVNLYVSEGGFWAGDAPVLLRNAALWSTSAVGWLRADPPVGIVPAGGSLDVRLVFDATGLPGGTYDAVLAFHGNDPVSPRIPIAAHLDVTGAADIDVSPPSVDFGPTFVGAESERTVEVANSGTVTLEITEVVLDGQDFAVASVLPPIAPAGSTELPVRFTPTSGGEKRTLLRLRSNDPDEPEVEVELVGLGLEPPVIALDPLSFDEALLAGQVVTRTLVVSNPGGSALDFVVGVQRPPQVEVPAQLPAPRHVAPAAVAPEPVPPVPLAQGFDPAEFPEPREPEVVVPRQGPWYSSSGEAGAPFEFEEDFEDGDFAGWFAGVSQNLKEVTDETAANGSSRSLHQVAEQRGHFTGIYREFDQDVRPRYVGFWIRPGSTAGNSAYFVLRDRRGCPSINGCELIWFFAKEGGYFYINADVGGNELVPYAPNTWYHVEFKNIDFELQRFDYWVDGVRIEAGIPFRRQEFVEALRRVDLYLFDPGTEGWWDEITIADVEPPQPVGVGPTSGSVPAGGSTELRVTFDARGVPVGSHPWKLIVDSNDPANPRVTLPATLGVANAPDIELPEPLSGFGSAFVGDTVEHTLVVANAGTDLLSVTGVTSDSPEFSAGETSFDIQAGGRHELLLRFHPTSAGAKQAQFTLHSDDPDEPQISIGASGQGLAPPVFSVQPQSVEAELFTGGRATRDLVVENHGGSDLAVTVRVERDAAATGEPFEFADDFEDGDFDGWRDAGGSGEKVVTDETAANGTRYSYHERFSPGGHFTGVYQVLGGVQPRYAGVWVRPSSPGLATNYFAMRNFAGFEGIFFFAHPAGQFWVNTDVGGDSSVSFTPGTWYHIEFKNIDFVDRRFDYWVDNRLVAARIPFRNAAVMDSFHRLDLYNFSPGSSGYWDEILITTDTPVEPFAVSPLSAVVAPGGRSTFQVIFDATGLTSGSYGARIVLASNDPLARETEVAARLEVTSAPDIEVTPLALDFGTPFVGVSVPREVRLRNRGPSPLTITELALDDPRFVVDAEAPLTLASGATHTVRVSFQASAPGSFEAALAIRSDDPDEPELSVQLSASAIPAPDATLTPESLLVELFTGQKATRQLLLDNVGGSPLRWEIAFASGPRPLWLLVDPLSGVLPPGGRAAPAVELDAQHLGGGDYTETILVRSDDPGEPELSVAVLLRVTSAADVLVTPTTLDLGVVFLGTTTEGTVTFANVGSAPLELSAPQVEGAAGFSVDGAGTVVAPGSAHDVVVRFSQDFAGIAEGWLVLATNDPDEEGVRVALRAESRPPPEAAVEPSEMAETLAAGTTVVRPLTIRNLSGGDLEFEVAVEPQDLLEGIADASVGGSSGPRVELLPADSQSATAALPPGPTETAGRIAFEAPAAAVASALFADDFEDGDFEDWELGASEGIKEITSLTAADGSRYSYREYNSSEGHVDGIWHPLPGVRPEYVSFWVRLGSTEANAGYFVLRDGAGYEAIFFFAAANGRFYVNGDVGGDTTFPYRAERWHFIEFKNIDFTTHRFDFFVDRRRVRRNIGLRNPSQVDEFSRIDLYNHDRGSGAYWDQIAMAHEAPFTPIVARPTAGRVAAGESAEVAVTFDAIGLNAGAYAADVVVRSNDPDDPVIAVPARLTVFGTPDIGVSRRTLEFGTARIGVPEERSVTVTNFGTDALVVSQVRTTGGPFAADVASFALAPEQSRAVGVTFAPTVEGAWAGTLTLSTNDPDNAELEITLLGEAIAPAIAGVVPEALVEQSYPGELSLRALVLSNAGGERLDYTIDVRASAGGPIPAEATLFFDDVESADRGWVTEVYGTDDLWHRSQRSVRSPTTSFWCGNEETGHYGTPYAISNALISPPIDLRDLPGAVWLTFSENYRTEPVWDECLVDVSVDGGATWLALRGRYGTAPSGDSKGWITTRLELTAFKGRMIRLRFYFETQDPTNNALPGWFVDDVRVSAVVDPWLAAMPAEGSLERGDESELQVAFDARKLRPPGTYQAAIAIASNDPLRPRLDVPATLVVAEPPRIAFPGETVNLVSTVEAPGRSGSVHSIALDGVPAGRADVRVRLEGDYGAPEKTATASVEGFVLGVTGDGQACTPTEHSFALAALDFDVAAADRRLDLELRNSAAVRNGSCSPERHTLELSYAIARERLDLGAVSVGVPTTAALRVKNVGNGELHVDAVPGDPPGATVTPASFALAAGEERELAVSVTPQAPGPFASTLRWASNDPARPISTLTVEGLALSAPARLSFAPDAIVAALPPGAAVPKTRTLHLENSGQGLLAWSLGELAPWLRVEPTAGSLGAGESIELHLELSAADLADGEHVAELPILSNDPTASRVALPVTLRVGWTALTEFALRLTPKYASGPGTVEAQFELPSEYPPDEVALETVSIHGVPAHFVPVSIADADRDGIAELVLQFDAAAFAATLPTGAVVPVRVEGEVRDRTWFRGTTWIRGVSPIGR